MLALFYWLDNSKIKPLEVALAGKRILPKDKTNILKALREEEHKEKPRLYP